MSVNYRDLSPSDGEPYQLGKIDIENHNHQEELEKLAKELSEKMEVEGKEWEILINDDPLLTTVYHKGLPVDNVESISITQSVGELPELHIRLLLNKNSKIVYRTDRDLKKDSDKIQKSLRSLRKDEDAT